MNLRSGTLVLVVALSAAACGDPSVTLNAVAAAKPGMPFADVIVAIDRGLPAGLSFSGQMDYNCERHVLFFSNHELRTVTAYKGDRKALYEKEAFRDLTAFARALESVKPQIAACGKFEISVTTGVYASERFTLTLDSDARVLQVSAPHTEH